MFCSSLTPHWFCVVGRHLISLQLPTSYWLTSDSCKVNLYFPEQFVYQKLQFPHDHICIFTIWLPCIYLFDYKVWTIFLNAASSFSVVMSEATKTNHCAREDVTYNTRTLVFWTRSPAIHSCDCNLRIIIVTCIAKLPICTLVYRQACVLGLHERIHCIFESCHCRITCTRSYMCCRPRLCTPSTGVIQRP